MCLEIKEGALFISDAHENENGTLFYHFLKQLDNGKIKTEQLFLMGDMFDLLVGEITYTKSLFKEHITLINQLCTKLEIIYFEGNHDFNLQILFPHIKVFKISTQPLLCSFNEKKLLLSHGDLHQTVNYKIYTKLIRNPQLLWILNFFDERANNLLSKRIITSQTKKTICRKIDNFQEIIKQKTKYYDIEVAQIDFICEGHHHQNKKFVFDNLKYINFSSFACERSYYKIIFTDEIQFREIYL